MAPTSKVTVVVPCCNQVEGLQRLLERLRIMRTGPAADWQLLFVDDGSTDDTFARLLCAARDEPGVSVLRHDETRGVGAALRTAFAHVTTPVVCAIDSGCAYPPERLPDLVTLIDQGADVATAGAWHPVGGAGREGSRLRLLVSQRVARVYKQLIGQDVGAVIHLFSAFRREVVQRIAFRGDGVSAIAELLLKATLAGYVVRQLAIPPESRPTGDPRQSVADAVLAHAHLITLATLAVGARQARQAFWRNSSGGRAA